MCINYGEIIKYAELQMTPYFWLHKQVRFLLKTSFLKPTAGLQPIHQKLISVNQKNCLSSFICAYVCDAAFAVSYRACESSQTFRCTFYLPFLSTLST